MALLTRSRRAAPSEFTLNYYDREKNFAEVQNFLKKSDIPKAPTVPPLLPRDVGGSWSAPPRVNPAIWRSSHVTKLHQAKSATSFSQRQREENRRLCKEVRDLTEANLASVNRRLEDRRTDVEFWRQELDNRHIELSNDAADLTEMRDRLDRQLEKFLHPLQVVRKCVELRELRTGVEKVEDEVSLALIEEIKEIEHCRAVLARTLADTNQQIRNNRSCLYHLEKNVVEKRSALEVDKVASELTPLEPPSMLMPSQKFYPSSVTVSTWRNLSTELTQRAENDHNLSVQIASVADAMLTASARQVRESVAHTNKAFSRRIADTEHAKARLEEEHSQIVREENELLKSISDLESELEAKTEPLTIAQTRLKTRQTRPTREQTRDEVEAALMKEVSELELTTDRLMKALEFSRQKLKHLTASRISLELDINLKTKTLQIDAVEIQDLRSTVYIQQC